MQENITYESFKQEWLEEVLAGEPSTVELGNRFARKIMSDWLDFDAESDDIVFCDGAGDGGIDVACLITGDIQEDGTNEGNTWYLVQSKHGSAFRSSSTILVEGEKVIETLRGNRVKLSSLAEGLSEKIRNFIQSKGENDRLKLVYATHDALSVEETRAMENMRLIGKGHFGEFFEVEAVSIFTIYNRLMELESSEQQIQVKLKANLAPSGSDLRVGSVNLIEIYNFLDSYKRLTNDLDRLYEKNVRKFLGGGRVINKGIANTLKNEPEKFGLYNNGITIVVEDFREEEDGYLILTEPFVVNGCQTTKTIWTVLDEKIGHGALGTLSSELQTWKSRLDNGVVVIKIVKVGQFGESLLTEITRFTNSQNYVGRQDFIALESNFRTWSTQMGNEYDVYLEIHRGGWESQKWKQRHTLSGPKYDKHANAFDLLKIFGAAWLSEPGTAFGKNPPFAPGGAIFKRIVNDNPFFSVKDLYACFLLQQQANKVGFGRLTKFTQRRQTRFLFYFIIGDLVKDVLIKGGRASGLPELSESIIRIFSNLESEAAVKLTEIATNLIDAYMVPGEDTVLSEPEFKKTNDLNAFLKFERLGKGRDHTPMLDQQLGLARFLMNQKIGGTISIRETILNCLDL
ncbi:MAG: AIPR family protein [Saprospiraceae bacterium]